LGANDVTHLTPIGSQRRNVETIIAGLRATNPNVAIVVTGSPDMGSPPRIPRLLRGLAGRRTRSVNEMYRALVREKGLTFAPIADETGSAFRADPTLFASDRFHPNERGYALWTTVLNRALAEAIGKQ
ncbi:MAG: GDSL-type esterase/lipase family protein, partial [Acidobacteriota bacterium]